MLENYEKLPNGVIKQIEVNKTNYGFEYSNKYNNYGELSNYMSYLRLGFLIAVTGKIPDSILDVGYGNGDFLKACSNIISNCYGSDITNEYPLPNNVKWIENIYKDEYDVVCFFDVLEHFDNIYEIKDLNTKYVYISVPECHNFNDEWFKEWKHRRPDEHLWHFDSQALINFMEELDYKCLRISNLEDTIRKNKTTESNILSAIFVKN